MINKSIIVMIIGLLICVSISGCIETGNTKNKKDSYITLRDTTRVYGDTDKLSFDRYRVEVYRNGELTSTYNSHDQHTPNHFYGGDYYILKGSIRNIDDEILENVTVSVRFYYQGAYLFIKNTSNQYLEEGRSWSFSIRVEGGTNIDEISFILSVN